MRMDRRVKHGVEMRKKAAELFASGMGSCAVASTLSVPLSTVKTWHHIYHAFGSEVLLTMDGKALYTYEQKVAAARAVIEGGMTRTEATAEFKIMSLVPLKSLHQLLSGESDIILNSAIASAFVMPSSMTALAAATFCS